MSDRKLSPEQRAGDIVDAWEHFEGETMRDGHRATLESLIASQIREAADEARHEEREALREWAKQTSYRDVIALNQVLAWIDARSLHEEPKV